MAAAPGYAATLRFGGAAISSADTSRTAPASVGTVLTAGASGSRVDVVHVNATGTTTAGTVRLWVYTGSVYYLLKEVEVLAVVPSATQIAWAVDMTFDGGILLPASHSLRATTHNAEAFVVLAFGGDL